MPCSSSTIRMRRAAHLHGLVQRDLSVGHSNVAYRTGNRQRQADFRRRRRAADRQRAGSTPESSRSATAGRARGRRARRTPRVPDSTTRNVPVSCTRSRSCTSTPAIEPSAPRRSRSAIRTARASSPDRRSPSSSRCPPISRCSVTVDETRTTRGRLRKRSRTPGRQARSASRARRARARRPSASAAPIRRRSTTTDAVRAIFLAEATGRASPSRRQPRARARSRHPSRAIQPMSSAPKCRRRERRVRRTRPAALAPHEVDATEPRTPFEIRACAARDSARARSSGNAVFTRREREMRRNGRPSISKPSDSHATSTS